MCSHVGVRTRPALPWRPRPNAPAELQTCRQRARRTCSPLRPLSEPGNPGITPSSSGPRAFYRPHGEAAAVQSRARGRVRTDSAGSWLTFLAREPSFLVTRRATPQATRPPGAPRPGPPGVEGTHRGHYVSDGSSHEKDRCTQRALQLFLWAPSRRLHQLLMQGEQCVLPVRPCLGIGPRDLPQTGGRPDSEKARQ